MTAATTLSPPRPADALELVRSQLDLTNLRSKLVHPDEPNTVTLAQLDQMEQEYQRFLALKLAYPEAEIVPCKIVDELWHRHILDTAAYRADCEAIFGHFVDHFPYFGIRSATDAQDLRDAYAETIALYRDAFGEPPPETWISREATRCRTACKPMKCR